MVFPADFPLIAMVGLALALDLPKIDVECAKHGW
jgi:hypothetical protein